MHVIKVDVIYIKTFIAYRGIGRVILTRGMGIFLSYVNWSIVLRLQGLLLELITM